MTLTIHVDTEEQSKQTANTHPYRASIEGTQLVRKGATVNDSVSTLLTALEQESIMAFVDNEGEGDEQ